LKSGERAVDVGFGDPFGETGRAKIGVVERRQFRLR